MSVKDRIQIEGAREKLTVARVEIDDFRGFIIGIDDKELNVGLHFMVDEENAEKVARWMLSRVRG